MVKVQENTALVGIVLLGFMAVASTLWILNIEWPLSWLQVLTPAHDLPLDALIVQNNTLPRMAIALIAGGALSVATMLMQQVMRNPLAADSTLSVSGGAQTALVFATIFAPYLLVHGSMVIAFAGSALALFAVLWLSARRELQPLTVVLAGLVMTFYLSAISGIITLFYSEEVRGMMLWGAGSLMQDSWDDALRLTMLLLLSFALVAVVLKPLNILGLNDQQAISLGISVKKIRLFTLIITAFISASVVATVGMMGFIGLAAASITRQLGVRTLNARLMYAFLFGALLLLITDNILVLVKIYYYIELPTGSVTALIGAPLLLWLMTRIPTRPELQTINSTMIKTTVSPILKVLPAALLLAGVVAIGLGQSLSGWHVTWDAVILALRLPRVLLAAACGILLASCGVLLQRITQNPMASPELLGISSGTTVGVMAALVLFNVASNSLTFWLVGLLSSLVTLGFIVLLNRRDPAPEKILLTGMAIAALSDAALRVWSAGGDFRIQQLLIWLSGSTYQATPFMALTVCIIAVMLTAASLPLSRWLALLSLSPSVAQSAGVNVLVARRVIIILSALLTSLATLLIGPLSFVGLLAPHMANLLGARLPKQQMLTAAVLGAVVMIIADWLGRQVFFPYEVPAGLVATLLGGGYFLWMIRRM